MSNQCKICGTENCKTHTLLIGKVAKLQYFSGSSPPEIFIGKWNYPNVYAGILSPQEHGDTKELSEHEIWHKKKLPIEKIISLRKKLILARDKTNVHRTITKNSFLSALQEIAMTHKSIEAKYYLKKPISLNSEKETLVPLISNSAEIEKVKLEENAPVKSKIEYLVNDTEVKSKDAIIELNKAGIPNSSIIKILSAGLIGLKKNRKLVPTRWSITAVDDTLSKEKLKKIKLYQEISEILVFEAEYIGNHYEFLLLPEKFSFEVIEISQKEIQKGNPTTGGIWHDYETYFDRKKYADSVTGAYYANRLALCEYLEKIKRQCSCLVIREIRPEYSAPLGVGILRQISREAFSKKPEKFLNLKEALNSIQKRLRLSISHWTEKSIILKNYGKQKRISEFF